MAKKLSVGILGLTHDHLWNYLPDLAASSLGDLVAAADPNPELRDRIQEEYGCPYLFESYEEMLDQAKLDAVYIFAANALAADLVEEAAARGLHIMVEKPMAADLAGAERMVAAARSAGVKLMVNWPIAWDPGLQTAMVAAQSGQIGQILSVRHRAAHAGPKEIGCSTFFYDWLYDPELNGAGALMDFCCYGAALARHLLGQPSRVTAVSGRLFKDYITAEDNAVLVMQWARAIAISEASWTQIGQLPTSPTTIYGSEGTLMVERQPQSRVLLATAAHPAGIEVESPQRPEEERSGTAFFLNCIQQDLPISGLCSAEVGRDTQEILQAGLLSVASNSAVSLPLPIA